MGSPNVHPAKGCRFSVITTQGVAADYDGLAAVSDARQGRPVGSVLRIGRFVSGCVG